MTKDQIIEKLSTLITLIDQAQIDIDAGRVRDLSAMDHDVAKVCDDIVALPPEQAQEVQPVMADMITRLEKLAGSLQSFKVKD